jgi:hypothetical protein
MEISKIYTKEGSVDLIVIVQGLKRFSPARRPPALLRARMAGKVQGCLFTSLEVLESCD